MLRPGGTLVFCGEPSRYGDLISQVPKRAAVALAPLGGVMRATKRDHFAGPAARRPSSNGWWTSTRSRRGLSSLASGAASRTSAWGARSCRRLFGWMNRTLESTAEPEDIPWLWSRTPTRLPGLQTVDPPSWRDACRAAIFYNLLISARKPVSLR